MYSAVIIEDEHHLREALTILLNQVAPGQVQITGHAEAVGQAVKLIDRLEPDLIFMDIVLKDGTGFEVLSAIRHTGFRLIFTTAYEKYAVRAFRCNAIDYLLKPLDPAELREALERIVPQPAGYPKTGEWQAFSQNLKQAPERIVLPTQEAMHVVRIDQIVRCETSGSYTYFLMLDGRKIIVSRPLKHYQDVLAPPQFFRVHQSHLINTAYIRSYSRDGTILMEDQGIVPVSRANKEAFYRFIKQRL